MLHKFNNKGFAAVEAILIVVIVAILAGTGYYVYQAQNKSTDDLNQANSESGSAVVYKKKSSKAPASTTAPKFLVIKEWNVKIPLSNADSGAYYTAPATYGLVQDVSVFDKSIDVTTNSDGKSCKDGNYPLLAISRVKVGDLASVTDPNSPNFIADTGPADFKKVTFTAQYEFAGSTHNQAGPQCLTLQSTGNITKTEPTIEPKYTAVQQALIDSYNHLQAE